MTWAQLREKTKGRAGRWGSKEEWGLEKEEACTHSLCFTTMSITSRWSE